MSEWKTFTTILVLDWKRESFKIYKKLPKQLKPSEIPIDFSLKVKLPGEIKVRASGEIVLSETQVANIVAEAL